MSQALATLNRLEKSLRFTDKGNPTNLVMDIGEGMSDEDHDNRLDWEESNLYYSIYVYTKDKRTIYVELPPREQKMKVNIECCSILMTDIKVIEKENGQLVLIVLLDKVEVAKIWL